MPRKQKRKERQLPAKRRQPKHGDSNVGLPGVMDLADWQYVRAYRYSSGVAKVRGRNG